MISGRGGISAGAKGCCINLTNDKQKCLNATGVVLFGGGGIHLHCHRNARCFALN